MMFMTCFFFFWTLFLLYKSSALGMYRVFEPIQLNSESFFRAARYIQNISIAILLLCIAITMHFTTLMGPYYQRNSIIFQA